MLTAIVEHTLRNKSQFLVQTFSFEVKIEYTVWKNQHKKYQKSAKRVSSYIRIIKGNKTKKWPSAKTLVTDNCPNKIRNWTTKNDKRKQRLDLFKCMYIWEIFLEKNTHYWLTFLWKLFLHKIIWKLLILNIATSILYIKKAVPFSSFGLNFSSKYTLKQLFL